MFHKRNYEGTQVYINMDDKASIQWISHTRLLLRPHLYSTSKVDDKLIEYR